MSAFSLNVLRKEKSGLILISRQIRTVFVLKSTCGRKYGKKSNGNELPRYSVTLKKIKITLILKMLDKRA